jgi:hypothetical protein
MSRTRTRKDAHFFHGGFVMAFEDISSSTYRQIRKGSDGEAVVVLAGIS